MTDTLIEKQQQYDVHVFCVADGDLSIGNLKLLVGSVRIFAF